MKSPGECSLVRGFVPSQGWLRGAYNELCEEYFSGDRMPSADSEEIVLDRKPVGRAHAAAHCSFRREVKREPGGKLVRSSLGFGEFAVKGFVIGNIGISFSPTNNDDMTEKDAYETLIHEMIHIWQYLNETPTEWAAMPHGRNFLIKARGPRADGWNVGIRGIEATRREILSPRERLRKKYGH